MTRFSGRWDGNSGRACSCSCRANNINQDIEPDEYDLHGLTSVTPERLSTPFPVAGTKAIRDTALHVNVSKEGQLET